MAEWVYDFIVAYRLTSDVVQGFLFELFGNYNFSVELVNDHFRFVIPRNLSNAEREALLQRKDYNTND